MSDEQFPAPTPDELAPARKASSRERAKVAPSTNEQVPGRLGRPDDQQRRYQAHPPEYQAQPPGYPTQPQSQPAHLPQPPQQQPAPGYQYPYQQQPQYQYPHYGNQHSYLQQPPLAQKSGRTSPWMVAVAAIALLVPVAVGGWYVLGRAGAGTTNPSDPQQPGVEQPDPDEGDQQSDPEATERRWPTNPQLQHSFTIQLDPEDTYPVIPIEGSVDDLFIGETNGATSRITRYVDGVATWQSDVGLNNTGYLYLDDDILILNSATPDYDSDSIARLDPETGSKIWEVTSTRSIFFRFIEDRFFILERDFGPNEPDQVLSEYDLDSGTQLNRIEGPDFEILDDGFVLRDPIELTVQLLDLDFQPVGAAVAVEASGSPSYPIVATHYAGGWIYYANRTISGGDISIVGLSDTGDQLFTCPVSIEEAGQVELHDETTLVVSEYGAIEVLDFGANTCSPRWAREATDNGTIGTSHDYIYVYTYHYDSNDEPIDSDIDALDWNTGEVIASGTNILMINDDEMITYEGQSLVLKRLSDGEVQWSIPTPGETIVGASSDWLSITTESGATASVDIYAD